jgi:hypothetical protein
MHVGWDVTISPLGLRCVEILNYNPHGELRYIYIQYTVRQLLYMHLNIYVITITYADICTYNKCNGQN